MPARVAATPVLLNLASIAAALWLGPAFQHYGVHPIYAQAVGVMIGGVVQLAIQFPARVEQLVLVSAAGLTVEYQRHDRALGVLRYGARLIAVWGGFVGARSAALASRPRTRWLLMNVVVSRPDQLSPARYVVTGPLLTWLLRKSIPFSIS